MRVGVPTYNKVKIRDEVQDEKLWVKRVYNYILLLFNKVAKQRQISAVLFPAIKEQETS